MKSGFTLIELVIGVMLASMISLVLYQTLNQTNKSTQIIKSTIDLDTTLALVYNQLDKDLSGVYIPREEPLATLPTTPKTTTTSAQKSTTTQEAKQTTTTQAPYKFEKIFYATEEKDNLKMLTFITTNALEADIANLPHSVRVVYRLIQDDDNKDKFKLVRQQSAWKNLDIIKDNKMEKFRGYDVATGIKKFSIKYFATEEPKEDQKKPSYTALKEWGSEEQIKKYKQEVPAYLGIDGEIWDDTNKSKRDFKFMFKVFGFEMKKEKKKEVEKAAGPAKSVTGQQAVAAAK